MPRVKILTDSTAYLPEQYLKELNIEVIPLHVIWGEEMLKDNVDITPDEFYKKLPESKIMPTTSQPSPKEFMNYYEKMATDGSEILSIHISSKLSGTVDSALQAKNMMPKNKIEVVDSFFTSMGMGFQVIAAARAAKKGASLPECKAITEKIRENTHIYFVVATLEFLKRGGRIGGAAALLGSALDLKPILCLKDGKIEAFDKVRTMKKSIIRIADILSETVGSKRPIYLGIAQATAPEDAAHLKSEIFNRFTKDDFVDVIEAGISPVIGTHTGPGAIALCFATED